MHTTTINAAFCVNVTWARWKDSSLQRTERRKKNFGGGLSIALEVCLTSVTMGIGQYCRRARRTRKRRTHSFQGIPYSKLELARSVRLDVVINPNDAGVYILEEGPRPSRTERLWRQCWGE